jgi:hypothetical protein
LTYWVLLGLLPAVSWAADLEPLLDAAKVGIVLRHLPYPATLVRDLKSGLTTHFLVRVTLSTQSHAVGTKVVDLAIKYDLWEETFRLTVTADKTEKSQTFSTIEQVMAFLSDLNLPNLFAAGELPPSTLLIARAEVLLNPIDRERMERLRKWVAENSTPLGSAAPVGPNSVAAPSAFASETFFNRIFEQYSAGNDTAAWHAEVSSKFFTQDDLSHVGHQP